MSASAYDYETNNGGEWGGVKRTSRGFTVETHSRYQGTLTGERVHVPRDVAPTWAVSGNLSAEGDDGDTVGAAFLRWLRHARETGGTSITSRIRVLRRGQIVQ